MRIAYLDAFSGIAGDMMLGAFLDLGLPRDVLDAEIAKLKLPGIEIRTHETHRLGIRATKVDVLVAGKTEAPGAPHGAHAGHGSHHSCKEILARIRGAGLGARTEEHALAIFRQLAIAEGRVHGKDPEEVHFHEVGAFDAIVDIVGAAIGFSHFGIDRVFASAVPLGAGFVRTDHGRMPVPAPATLELLRGHATLPADGDLELVTPTGAAIIAALAEPGAPPPLRPFAIGYGAGTLELEDRPNVLRLVLADPAETTRPAGLPPRNTHIESDQMLVIETNIDDMNPEFFRAATEALFAAGARDVTLHPITMKQGRPATCLQVIAAPQDEEALSEIILRQTTSIGVRSWPVQRRLLRRMQQSVATPYGAIACKIVILPDGSERTAPEATDLERAAREHQVPIARVLEAVLEARGPAEK
ncbi:MAG: nickel pincer cofactor biosynthesis protein LarC [Deltaproteobacteria bacterium]